MTFQRLGNPRSCAPAPHCVAPSGVLDVLEALSTSRMVGGEALRIDIVGAASCLVGTLMALAPGTPGCGADLRQVSSLREIGEASWLLIALPSMFVVAAVLIAKIIYLASAC